MITTYNRFLYPHS